MVLCALATALRCAISSAVVKPTRISPVSFARFAMASLLNLTESRRAAFFSERPALWPGAFMDVGAGAAAGAGGAAAAAAAAASASAFCFAFFVLDDLLPLCDVE